jgi:hypothetical protein
MINIKMDLHFFMVIHEPAHAHQKNIEHVHANKQQYKKYHSDPVHKYFLHVPFLRIVCCLAARLKVIKC